VFCDWYLELAKPVLTGDNAEAKAETRATAAWTLDQILALLHPFQPFVTEELWERTGETGPARDTMLVQAAWPVLDGMVDETAAADINWLIDLVTAIRSVRAEMNVPPGAQVPLALVAPDGATTDRAARYDALLSRLARLSSIETVDVAPAGAIQVVVGETVVALSVADVIDISGERQRLSKDMEKLDKEIGGFEKKLGNAQFMERAPDHVIEEQRERKADAEARREKLKGALARLEGAA
ncbi:MAG: class I tRNA ligase family protein, partial [Pseudomonadota bacterium]